MTTDPIITDDEIIGGILDELGTVTSRVDTLAELAERVERMERMCAALVDILGIGADNLSAEPCPMHEPGDPDCRPSHGAACRPPDRPHTLEQAWWVAKGDTIQAVHGDPVWERVVSTVRAVEQTGLVTRTADDTTRVRWWAHRDLVRVATAPVPDPTPYRAAR